MNMEAIKARQFWQGIVDDAVAKMSDSAAVESAQAFAKPGSVAVLQLTNHSGQRAKQLPRTVKIVEVDHKWAILNNTILDKITPPRKPIQRTARRRS